MDSVIFVLVQIWRVEKFEVKEWPEEEYGRFYEGDSYIILRTYKVYHWDSWPGDWCPGTTSPWK
tara:strand:+ start:69 stop:260 length:192 start_codon:yes stop_codon:yes gene_type:complete